MADTRIHGTTRRQVKEVFEQVGEAGAVAAAGVAVRSVPGSAAAACIATGMWRSRGRTTRSRRSFWASGSGRGGTGGWSGCSIRRCVRSRCMRSARRARSPRSTPTSCRRRSAASNAERTWLLRRVESHRPARHAAGRKSMLQNRGIEGVRVLMGLLSLANQARRDRPSNGPARSPRAMGRITCAPCGNSSNNKTRSPVQQNFEFVQEHPIIRDLGDYGQFVRPGALLQQPPLQESTP